MIYCVEDERNIRELIVYTLNSSGFEAKGCVDGEALFKEKELKQAEMILLDIMLPGEDGFSILQKLKSKDETKNIPVIMITAKDAEYDKVRGLDLGADDYIPKPFGMMEFLARVRAVLRRAERPNKTAEDETITYKNLTLKPQQHLVLSDGNPVELTLKDTTCWNTS